MAGSSRPGPATSSRAPLLSAAWQRQHGSGSAHANWSFVSWSPARAYATSSQAVSASQPAPVSVQAMLGLACMCDAGACVCIHACICVCVMAQHREGACGACMLYGFLQVPRWKCRARLWHAPCAFYGLIRGGGDPLNGAGWPCPLRLCFFPEKVWKCNKNRSQRRLSS